MAVGKESFFWHKVHSLTGVIPIGFYMLQHLTLNSFSIAGPAKFNSVIGFFESVPKHILLALEIGVLGIPILFHAVYGLFIVGRAKPNFLSTKYKWPENRMYGLQRWSGVILFFLLILHVVTTTVNAKINGEEVILWQAWHDKLTANGYIVLVLYALGVVAASYHLAYGIWNFCIRWGITISERSQLAVQKFSFVFFIVVTALGWGALAGFLVDRDAGVRSNSVHVSAENPMHASLIEIR
ncbi:MAG: hypothetical protein M9921_10805 [Fimbriimonadaceae bacterium]|nr:hypothetical protein [Fimbriimonadaceae bacterium]